MQTNKAQITNCYKLFKQHTAVYPRIDIDRPWQVRVELKELIAAKTIPLLGKNPVRGRPALTDRNLRRVTKPKKNSPVIHWASTNGMELVDAKKASNAAKRLRKKLDK